MLLPKIVVILIISSYFLLFILVGCGDLTVQGFVHFSSPVNYNLTTIFGSNILACEILGL
jgi:hypothetical protein